MSFKKTKYSDEEKEMMQTEWYAESDASKANFLADLLVAGVTLADLYTKFNTDDLFFYTMCGIFVADGNPDSTELSTRWRFFTDEKFDLKDFDKLGYEEFQSYTVLKQHPLQMKNFWDAIHRIYNGQVDPSTIELDFTQDFENEDSGFEADLGDDYRRLCRIQKLYAK